MRIKGWVLVVLVKTPPKAIEGGLTSAASFIGVLTRGLCYPASTTRQNSVGESIGQQQFHPNGAPTYDSTVNSSALVGWIPTVESTSSSVAPIFNATP